MSQLGRPRAVEETACNLCGARDYEVVATTDRERRPLRTVICRRCGLVWTNPRPSAADMDAYYATEYRRDYKGAAAPPLRKIVRGMVGAQDRRRLIRELLRDIAAPDQASAHRRVLDVGCGAGELVYLLRRDRVDASGLEPGREYAEFASRALGIPVQNATVDTANIAAGSQDLVTMFHALEHVAEPVGVLRTVRGWLKPGGAVVVEVPNIESTLQAPAHRFHFAHLHHFTASTLAAAGEAAGLRHVRTEFSPDGGNVIAVFRRGSDQERPPAGLDAPAARTRAILAGHTTARHYLSLTPYRRALQRLGRRWAEDRVLRRFRTLDEVLRAFS